jgi:hypothetical protein
MLRTGILSLLSNCACAVCRGRFDEQVSCFEARGVGGCLRFGEVWHNATAGAPANATTARPHEL